MWTSNRRNPRADHLGVFRIEFAEHGVSTVGDGHSACSPRTAERVENRPTLGTPCQYARLNQVGRKCGEVSTLERFCRHSPDTAPITALTVDGILKYGLAVEIILLGFGQKEDILMSLGAAVAHTLGHRVRFVPDDVLSQIPTVSLQCERHLPRYSDKVLVFQPNGGGVSMGRP